MKKNEPAKFRIEVIVVGHEKDKNYLVEVYTSARETWEVRAVSLLEALAAVAAGEVCLIKPKLVMLIPEAGIRGVVAVEEMVGGEPGEDVIWRKVPEEEIREAAELVLLAPQATFEEVLARITGGDSEDEAEEK